MNPDELLNKIHRVLMLQCGELSEATLSILKDVEGCLMLLRLSLIYEKVV